MCCISKFAGQDTAADYNDTVIEIEVGIIHESHVDLHAILNALGCRGKSMTT